MEPRRRNIVRARVTPRLVRGLLIASVAAAIASGCLIDPPPYISDPSPSRPNVNQSQVVPPTYQVLGAEHNGPAIEFTIPLRSEDAGERLWAFTWINWNLEGAQPFLPRPFPPAPNAGMGGAGSTEHAITFSWRPDARVEPGCNQLTVFLVHDRYADVAAVQPTDFNQSAMLTWWVNIDAPTGTERDLLNCPGPSVPALTTP